LKRSATSRWNAEPPMNAAAQAVVWRHYISLNHRALRCHPPSPR
jgi:hypothetical protein